MWVEGGDRERIRWGREAMQTAPFAAVTVTGKASWPAAVGPATGPGRGSHRIITLPTTTAARNVTRFTVLLPVSRGVGCSTTERSAGRPARSATRFGRYRPARRPGSSSGEDPQLRDSAGFAPDFAGRSVAGSG